MHSKLCRTRSFFARLCLRALCIKEAEHMKVLVIPFILFLASCVSMPPAVSSSTAIPISGLSVFPPENGKWHKVQHSAYQLVLMSRGKEKDESIGVNVSLFQLPKFDSDDQFLSYVKQGRSQEPKTGRFNILNNKEAISALKEAKCVKYHSISEDHGANKVSSNPSSMLLENIAYNCKHPLNESVGVNIEYSLRHYQKSSYESLESDAIAFFNAVNFLTF